MLRRLFLQLLYSPFFSKWLILETSIISALFRSHQILHSLNRISKLAPKSVSYHYSSGNKFVVHILYMTMNNLHCYLTSKRFLHNCCGSRNLSSPHCLPSLSANLVNSSYYHYCFPHVCQKCSWRGLFFAPEAACYTFSHTSSSSEFLGIHALDILLMAFSSKRLCHKVVLACYFCHLRQKTRRQENALETCPCFCSFQHSQRFRL